MLRREKLYAKLSKCEFFKTSIEFLGHVCSPDGIRPDPKNLEAIAAWPPLKTVTEVQSFLSLANFYRRFIRGFSHIATPLTALTKKGAPFAWTDPEEKAFQALKTALTSAPVLLTPDPRLPYTIFTDASDYAVGGILCQDQGTGFQPLAFESTKLNAAQLNYAVHEKEMYAIIHCYTSGVTTLKAPPPKSSPTTPLSVTCTPNLRSLAAKQDGWNSCPASTSPSSIAPERHHRCGRP